MISLNRSSFGLSNVFLIPLPQHASPSSCCKELKMTNLNPSHQTLNEVFNNSILINLSPFITKYKLIFIHVMNINCDTPEILFRISFFLIKHNFTKPIFSMFSPKIEHRNPHHSSAISHLSSHLQQQ